MEENALLLGDLANLGDRVNRPDFIVGQHDRDQNRLVRNRFPDFVGGDLAVFSHRQIGHLDAAFLQGFAGVQDRPVFRRAGDDVVAFFLVHLHGALEREVVGFRGSAGEDDLLGVAVDELGDLLAGLFDRFLGLPSELMVAAGGVAEFFDEVGQHRIEDSGVHRCRGVIIQKDRKLHCAAPSLSRFEKLTLGGRLIWAAAQWRPSY